MRCLLLSSCLALLSGCVTLYKDLPVVKGDLSTLRPFKPGFTVALYNTQIDVVGNHLSGLLLIKRMPDSTIRMVFSNEMGFKFFDFEFTNEGGFRVYSVIKKMNRKSVIKTLRHDFELVLMEGLDSNAMTVRSDGEGNRYHIFSKGKGFNCFITDSTGRQLVRMERSSKQEPVATIIMQHYMNGMPDTIGITHHKVDFVIGLKRLEQ